MIYIKFLIQWCIVCLYYEKKNFSMVHPPKMHYYQFLFLQASQGRQSWGVTWFWPGIYPKFGAFFQNLHYAIKNFVVILFTNYLMYILTWKTVSISVTFEIIFFKYSENHTSLPRVALTKNLGCWNIQKKLLLKV